MRLPVKENAIDVEQTKAMVDRFLEEGFVYFDTAYGYHGRRIRTRNQKALVDRYPRERFMLATKLPAWARGKNREEAEQMFIHL